MQLLNPLLKWVLKRPMRRIEHFMIRPEEIQEEVFKKLISSAKNTEWGEKYGYDDIINTQQYHQKVPISTYEEIFPYIERMMKGEENILWNTPINWFAKSSGTTNARSKFIPVSKESLEEIHFKGGKDLLALYISNFKDTQIPVGKGLTIGGSFEEFDKKTGIFYGDVSAVVAQNLPAWAEWLRTPSLEVAHMKNWDEKIERIAEETLKQNITCIVGVPTWTLLLLQRILEITGKDTIFEVWENLEAFFHGAVAFAPYRELFDKIAPGLKYLEVYNATEGFFGLQDDLSRDDMLLMLDYGIFYEFVPLEDIEQDHPKTYTIGDIELDKNYAVLISTNGGLWRYNIGDTIKFTSKYPHRFKITGRTKHFINAFGEELMIDNATQGITEACKATNASIIDYTAGPTYFGNKNKGGHEWLVEFDKVPDSMSQFTEVLDQKLREVNSDYDAKRCQNIALKLPIVRSLPTDTFLKWMRIRGKLGGQNKVPKLSNNREYLEEILQIIHNE